MNTERLHIEKLFAAIVELLSIRNDIVAAYVFGSQVHGPRTEESDLDVGVLFSETIPKTELLSLQQEISDRLGVQTDLVDLAAAPVVLRMQVLRKGKKILDCYPSTTTAFIVRTLFEYDDLKRVIKPIEDNILHGRIYG
jgi:hypothetical protein